MATSGKMSVITACGFHAGQEEVVAGTHYRHAADARCLLRQGSALAPFIYTLF
jgi:hypothetical protein